MSGAEADDADETTTPRRKSLPQPSGELVMCRQCHCPIQRATNLVRKRAAFFCVVCRLWTSTDNRLPDPIAAKMSDWRARCFGSLAAEEKRRRASAMVDEDEPFEPTDE